MVNLRIGALLLFVAAPAAAWESAGPRVYVEGHAKVPKSVLRPENPSAPCAHVLSDRILHIRARMGRAWERETFAPRLSETAHSEVL
jgi:hypothetical protein